MNRDHGLQQLRTSIGPFDFVIIGGGATGLGTAVDAASRGHTVCLIEQSDFAKGTSSRSTKLVHGGVRYLKQGNVSLVMEALKERGRLHRNAPHLVHARDEETGEAFEIEARAVINATGALRGSLAWPGCGRHHRYSGAGQKVGTASVSRGKEFSHASYPSLPRARS